MAFLMLVAALTFVPILTGEPKADKPTESILKMRTLQAEREREEIELAEKQPLSNFQGKKSHTYVGAKKLSRERYIRKMLEAMFSYKFISIRPKWLENPKTGRRLEIDMYCKELNLAVEYQGEAHYRFIPHFHKTYQKFQEHQERDMLKRRMLKIKGINLLEIPYTIPDPKLESFILEKCDAIFKRNK